MFQKIIAVLILRLLVHQIQCNDIGPKIVGGIETGIAIVPYQAILLYDGIFTCGGSIVAPKYIVTAAHCVMGKIARRFLIRVGSKVYNKLGQTARAFEIFYNDFDPDTFFNDIAMIKLIKSLQPFFGRLISPIKLPRTGAPLPTTAKISGWGKTSETNPGISVILKQALIRVFPNTECSKAYGSTFIGSTMFCAGRWDGIKDSCQGDSGGPLAFDNVLYGVISFGDGCGVPGKPGIYTNVANQRAWIDEIMKSNGD